MHTLQSLVSELTSMEHALTELGFQSADSDLSLHWGHSSPLRITLAYYCNGEPQNWDRTARTETDEALTELLAAAWTHIRQLKTPEQLARELFLHEFGRTLDKARDLGFGVEFLNPLEASMRQLSENILEDKSGELG
jgi:hypothetical protein